LEWLYLDKWRFTLKEDVLQIGCKEK